MLGLRPAEYYWLTYAEYNLMVEGHQLSEANEWERTRTLALFIYNTNAKRPLKDPKRLFKIFTDRLNGEPALTKEEMQALIEQAKQEIPV